LKYMVDAGHSGDDIRGGKVCRTASEIRISPITTAKGRRQISSTEDAQRLIAGIAEISPVWLNRTRTLDKIIDYVDLAAKENCQLVVFGEALRPGYPFWIERTDGARFNSPLQKEIHAHCMQNALQIEGGHLSSLCEAAAESWAASSGRRIGAGTVCMRPWSALTQAALFVPCIAN
jgi:hypothetical protein